VGELLRIAWRNATGSLGRTAMTLTAVSLGVAFLTGSLAVSDTLARSISVLYSSQYDSVDVVVRGESVAFGQRASLDEALVAQAASAAGAAAAAGVVEGYAQPTDLAGTPLGSAQQPGLGRTWIDDPALQTVPLLPDGTGPAGPQEVVLDATTADAGGIAVGDPIKIATSATVQDVVVTGIADVSSGTGSALTWFDPGTAQELLGSPGLVQEIFVASDGSVDADQLASSVAEAVGAGAEVLTGTEAAEQSQQAVDAVFGFFRVILFVFVGIGLVVCAFIVFNTFAVLTAQRARQLATLRAIGCSRRQVTGATLAEGFLVGLFGSTLGVLIGYFGTTGLIWLVSALELGEFGGSIVLRPATVAIAFGAGLLVTLLGAYPSARAAGRMPPVSAIRQSTAPPTTITVARIMVGFGGLALAVILVAQGAVAGYPNGIGPLVLGLLALLVGVAAWSRPLVIVLIQSLSPIARRLTGLAGDLAGRNSLRDAKRTTVTAGSLSLALALVTSMGILTSSTKATLDSAADTSLTADVMVLPVVGFTPMPATVTDQVRGAEGVAGASPILFDAAVIDFAGTFVTGVAADSVADVIALEMQQGSVSALAEGELLVSQTFASRQSLRVGQEVYALFAASGVVTVRIGGIFADNVYAGFALIDEDRFRALTGKSGVWYVYAATQDGADPNVVRDAVATEIEGTANTQALTAEEFTEFQDEVVDQALAGVSLMLLFAVIVAIVGVANTIALSVSERVREIGMLRAIGMTRRLVGRMIRTEAALTALAGAVIGILVGLFLGIAIRALLESIGFATLSIPAASLSMFFVLSVIAGVLAAALPARKASRLDVLDAIRGE
jgi:putative ABC transport system permease protein